MSRNRTSVQAPHAKYMGRQTHIRAPSVRTDWDWVNGKPKYTLIPPEIGPITTIDSDDSDEMKPVLRAVTPKIKREPSQDPSGQPPPRMKREFSMSKLLGGHRGLFITPNTPQRNRPFASSPSLAPQSRGKRPRDEAEDLDPAMRRAEWQRMMERLRNHEKEMEQTRGQLEKTTQMLADQERRIDKLEHQRRVDELQQELERQVSAEEKQVDKSNGADMESNDNRIRLLKRNNQKPNNRQRDAEPRISPERDGHVDGEVQPSPAPNSQRYSQRRLKRKVLGHPLSGHNPKLIFDDDDRANVSQATVFLLRLSQQEVLGKFSRYIENKDFFDVHHPDFKSMGCWVISEKATFDYKMKLWDRGEQHTFSFRRLAIRLWHDEESIYSLLQGKTQQKAMQQHEEQQKWERSRAVPIGARTDRGGGSYMNESSYVSPGTPAETFDLGKLELIIDAKRGSWNIWWDINCASEESQREKDQDWKSMYEIFLDIGRAVGEVFNTKELRALSITTYLWHRVGQWLTGRLTGAETVVTKDVPRYHDPETPLLPGEEGDRDGFEERNNSGIDYEEH
ncbi:hypothetical protein VPNG_10076 [Cytospora leucostoma]|uniref:Uncharacterized protein n=1 Tax=Cytospora leucostoma TaxID=1230097 RepID=A0A423VIV8_9PEZI|nr:hypothetical protein VPNG_10076 [Cytospora leucostoma]